MSPLLKNLALQAGGSHYPDVNPMQLEKFAKLIVEECGEVAYKAFWDNPETVRGIHIKEKIKQHFGVE